jgi:hypothetical protein
MNEFLNAKQQDNGGGNVSGKKKTGVKSAIFLQFFYFHDWNFLYSYLWASE